MTSYLGVTGHWLTAEWELWSELLAFSEIEGSHSGENMGEELYQIIKRFGIIEKVQYTIISASISPFSFMV